MRSFLALAARPRKRTLGDRVNRPSSWVFVASLCAGLCLSSGARANGRFPESNHLFFSDTDPDLVLLRTTFGLLVSHDRGKSFSWVCEPSIGINANEDAMYAVTPTNTWIGTTFDGITISHDQACSWSKFGGDLKGQIFIDLTQNPTDKKDVVVFTSSFLKQDAEGGIIFESKLWETKDEGVSFDPLGQPLDPDLLGYTVDLAKSDPKRIYISAVQKPGAAPIGELLTSKDHGATWEATVIPLVPGERSLYIAAVDPNDAERVYIRTSSTDTTKGDRLLLREAPDGGPATVRVIYTGAGALRGFALSPDGSKVYIGGPKDFLKVASTADFAFADRSSIQVGCLAISPEGLWACSNEQTGFIVGLSKDDGANFNPLIHFCDIKGALACPQGTPTNNTCTAAWPSQYATLGCIDAAANSHPDGGADGVDGGAANAQPLSSGGSGCQTTPPGSWGLLVGITSAAIALVRRTRRRRSA
jgi:hypothetical protein